VRRVPALAALLAAVACGAPGCSVEKGGPPPERFLPEGAAVAVVVPEAGRAARELAALHRTLLGFPGTAGLAGLRAALAAQLGFDPLDPAALAGAGIERRRGAGVALVGGDAGEGAASHALLVLPVSDASRLEDLLVRLGRERLGAALRSGETHGAAALSVLRRGEGEPPALTWAFVERTALVAAGPEGPGLVADAAALDPARALAAAPGFAVARRALGSRDAAIAYLPAGAALLRGVAALREGAALGLSAGEGRLTVRAAIVALERAAALRALPGAGAAGRAALRLSPASALVLRWDGDPAAFGRQLLPLAPARDRAWLAARGVDVERDLLPLLAPGAAASFALAPRAAIGSLSPDLLRADPLALVAFEAVLPVRDPAAAEEVAARLERALRGAQVRDPDPGSDRPPPRVHRVATPSGELAWTVDRDGGRVLAAGGPPGRLEALRARLAGDGDGFVPPTETARGAFAGGLGGAALDVPRLVASVRALPPEAFGSGPSSFVLRSMVNRLVDPADRLAAVTARAEIEDAALVLAIEAEARPRPEAGP